MQELIKKLEKLYEKPISEFDINDWFSILLNEDLSEDFIREFQTELDWYYISMCQKLSEDFIKEFQDKVNWESISICQELSEDFIKEFKERLS